MSGAKKGGPAVTTRSTALTRGVRVSVESRYLADQSSPATRRYVFAYTITIANEGRSAVQLRSRHWVITDGHGEVEEVRGPGVVGKQPRLEPGQAFEYTSGCPLPTSRGVMQGRFQMVGDEGPFDVEVAPFALELPHSVN